eukprot:14999644-Ditylum_brightwellii.AAC.1
MGTPRTYYDLTVPYIQKLSQCRTRPTSPQQAAQMGIKPKLLTYQKSASVCPRGQPTNLRLWSWIIAAW